jgi:hypothetical protein
VYGYTLDVCVNSVCLSDTLLHQRESEYIM